MKESSRASLHGTPFTLVPMVMVKGLLKLATLLLNAFLNSASISKTLSQHNILQGLPNLDFAMLKYEFGQYGKLSEDNTITNTMVGRTKGTITLYPKGDHGSWAFLSLSTGMQVHGRTFTPLPITDEVIDRVAELADAYYTNGGPACPSMAMTPSLKATMDTSTMHRRRITTLILLTLLSQWHMRMTSQPHRTPTPRTSPKTRLNQNLMMSLKTRLIQNLKEHQIT